MPEGDTLYRVARTLHKALAGRVVRRFDSAYAVLLRIDEEAPLAGRAVQRVEARGKWCLIWLGPRPGADANPAAGRWDGVLVLATHLRMNGMWHIYQAGQRADPGTRDPPDGGGDAPAPWRAGQPADRPAGSAGAREERWQRPRRDMRVLLATDDFVAVGFRVPVAKLLTPAELLRDPDLSRLGPDLCAEPFAQDEALRRLRARAGEELGQALLDQGAVAGLGNVYKSELCFITGLHPLLPVGAVSDAELRRLLAIGRRLLRANVYSEASPAELVTFPGRRRTTAAMDPRRRLWVYGRGGRPCRRCATPIAEVRKGLGARVTFFCPRCQPRAPSAGA